MYNIQVKTLFLEERNVYRSNHPHSFHSRNSDFGSCDYYHSHQSWQGRPGRNCRDCVGNKRPMHFGTKHRRGSG